MVYPCLSPEESWDIQIPVTAQEKTGTDNGWMECLIYQLGFVDFFKAVSIKSGKVCVSYFK